MTVGQRIAQKRKELGLSQEGLGERLGVSRQAIYKWESDAALPEIEKLVNLSREFGVSIDWLLGEEDEGREPQELTAEQLRMVEEIVGRYLAALPEGEPSEGAEHKPKNPAKWRKWLWVLGGAAAVMVIIVALMFSSLSARLDRVCGENGVLQASVANMRNDMVGQIYIISRQMEDILQRQNTLTVEQGAEVTDTDYRANTVTISARAVPRTYVEGMTAEFVLVSGGETVTVPGDEGENHAFKARLTGALTDDIAVSVVFLVSDQRQTQLIERFSGLYEASFPAVEIAGEVERPVAENGRWLAASTAEVSLSAVNGGEAEVTSMRLGLFRDYKLVAWYEEAERPRYPTSGPWRFELEEETVLEKDGLYCLAAFLTDEYDRTWVYSNMAFLDDGSANYQFYASFIYSADPADWEY